MNTLNTMVLYHTKSLDRNSRLSVAMVKNRAEQNSLSLELGHLEKEKRTAMRILQNDKMYFRVKYSRSGVYEDNFSNSNEALSKYFIPSADINESTSSMGDTSVSKQSLVDFEEIHNMLFTNDEIDIEKVLCLHLISAHRAECLAPPKKKLIHMCKIHSPLERLLERSKRKHIHQEQRMTNMMPIYTIETTEFGDQSDKTSNRDLINDGRLATRIMLNEKIRELINTVLNALRQSNPEKNYEIFEMANDICCLKKLFIKPKILDFLDDLMNCRWITSCESFILTAPFRVKSVQLEIRTISGTLESLVRQIRQNVLQIPTRAEIKQDEEAKPEFRKSLFRKELNYNRMSKRPSEEGEPSRGLESHYGDKQSRRSTDSEKKPGRHIDTNFVQKNKAAAANTKKVEYDSDEDTDYYHRPKRHSSSSSKSSSSRRSSEQSGNITERPNIQPIRIPEEVAAIMEDKEEAAADQSDANAKVKSDEGASGVDKEKGHTHDVSNRRKSSTDSEQIRIHLKQTTCPACMERYKIPLPPPKTPRVKPSSVIPLAPGENADLKTNSQNRISMLINKEMFKLQSYERRFSSDESARRNSIRRKELEACASSYIKLSPLELAKIEQEIKEKETQKKLEKFLKN